MMDLPRFFLPPSQLAGDAVSFLEADAAHLSRVLRLQAGERVYVLDGTGGLYLVELLELEKRAARGRILERLAARGELPTAVTLIQGLPKGEKFDWILQKATELGVSRIQPLITKRSMVKIAAERATDKLRRWEAIAREAAEQCERARIPEIASPCTFDAWIVQPPDRPVLRLACLERSDAPTLWQVLAALPHTPPLEVVVGPEGGFAPDEALALQASGAQVVKLGSRILRTETASLAALALISVFLES